MLIGTLTAEAFLGQTVRARVEIGGPAPLLVDVPAERWLTLDLAVGERVACGLDLARLLVFPGEGRIATAA